MVQNEYNCCCWPCKMHVETGALVIAILGSLLNIGQGIWAFCPTTETHGQNIGSGIAHMIAVIMYLSIILAQQKRKHRYYWPYLIVVGIELVILLIFILVAIGFFIAAPTWMIDGIDKANPEFKMDVPKLRFLIGIVLLGAVFSAALNSWFYWVIFKAYKFVRDEPAGGVGHSYPAV